MGPEGATEVSHDLPCTEDDVKNRVISDDRPEIHNPSIDEDVASHGACAMVHLPTGDTCTLAHNHPGSCRFTRRDDVPAALLRAAD